MHVLVLAPYPPGYAPSQRFRWEQYVEPLRARGVFLEASPFLDEGGWSVVHQPGRWGPKLAATARGMRRRLSDALGARRYDLALIHRESLPVGPAWVEPMLRAAGVPYAFDFDDAIYLPAASAANRRWAWLKAPGKVPKVMGGTSLVIAGNEDLAEWARRHTGNVVVVPTTIDTDAYRPAPRTADGPVCVGWSGSHTTIAHLRLLEPVLRALQREREVRLRVIGDPSYELQGADVEVLAWSPVTEVRDLSELDVGVMPLPDDEWSRGKCGLKALQYMALGIPTVMSPVGVNRRLARDGAALLAGTDAEWAGALRTLLDDPDLRARLGAAGRARVEREYSVHAVLPAWERALRAAAGRRVDSPAPQ